MAIDIGDAVLTLGVDTKDLDRGMKNIGAQIKKHQKAIGIGMAAAGTAIVAGMGLAMKAAADFETAMREVNTMMGLGQEEFAEFSKEVQKLAGDLGVDAVESAKALYQAISAGVPKENVLTFLEIATKAAIGGVTSTEVAVDGLTTVINAFKLPMSDAQKVADIMFTTVKGGKTTMEELSASMFQVAPIAAASGVKFEEVAAALATMTKQGVPTTIATTQLRQAMVALQKPTEDMNKVIKGLGYESGQAMLEELGLAGTLDILRNATEGSNEMLMKMFGSVEAGQAVLSLTGENMKMFIADLDAMNNSVGASDAAFLEMEISTNRMAASIKAGMNDIKIFVGNILLPILKDVMNFLKPVIQGIRTWAEAHPGLTKVIILGTGALGGLLIVLGSLLLMLPMITAATATFGVTLSAAIWPITLVVGAIGLLVAAGVLLWQNWGKVVDFFKLAWINIKMFFLTGIENILAALARFTDWLPIFGDKIQQAHDAISNMIDAEEVKKRALQVEDTLDSIATRWHKGADAISYQSHTVALSLDEVGEAAIRAADAVDGVSDAVDGSKIAIARARWEVNGATYVTSLYTKAEIKLAEEAGKKITVLEGQTRAIIDGADAAEDAAARLAALAAAEAAAAEAAKKAASQPAGMVWGGPETGWIKPGGGAYVGGGRYDSDLNVGMLSDEQRAEYERILAAAPGEFTPESLLKLMLLGIPMQKGGIVMRPITARIAERGPEAVIPLDRMMGGVTINVAELHVREEADVDRVARKMVQLMRQQQRMGI